MSFPPVEERSRVIRPAFSALLLLITMGGRGGVKFLLASFGL
jgi:hypothetical protein